MVSRTFSLGLDGCGEEESPLNPPKGELLNTAPTLECHLQQNDTLKF